MIFPPDRIDAMTAQSNRGEESAHSKPAAPTEERVALFQGADVTVAVVAFEISHGGEALNRSR